MTVYIDGVYEHRYQKNSGGTVLKEQTVLHVMDGRSRVATTHLGDEFGDFVDVDEPTHYNLEDHLGTSMIRLDHNGTVLDRMEYYPFGDTAMQTSEHKRYRYVGKELDSESGLYYYGARYYAAWVGRFVSVDPLAASYAHLNPYNYAGNKPIGDLDIDGMQATGESENGGTPTLQTGDDKLDAVANRIITDNDCHIVGILTEDNGVTTIFVNDDIIAKYHPDAGFADKNDNPLVADDHGHLSPAQVDDGNSDEPQLLYNPEFGYRGPIGPSKKEDSASNNAIVRESPPERMEPRKIESEPNPLVKATKDWVEPSVGAVEKGAKSVKETWDKSKSIREWTRKQTHQISKKYKDFKAGKLFQGVKKTIKNIGEFGKTIGKAARALGYAVAAYEFMTDTWDAHTFVNIGIAIGIGALVAISAPLALVVGVVAAVVMYAFDVDEKINAAIGRNSPFWKGMKNGTLIL